MTRKTFKNKALNTEIKIDNLEPFSYMNQEERKKKNKEVVKKNALHVTKERLEKLKHLLNNYEIDINDEDKWFWLSFKLAEEFVKGFKDVDSKRKTKKLSWSLPKMFALCVAVEIKKKRNPKSTYGSICAQLTREKGLWNDEKSLAQRYSDASNNEEVKSLTRILSTAGVVLNKKFYENFVKSYKL